MGGGVYGVRTLRRESELYLGPADPGLARQLHKSNLWVPLHPGKAPPPNYLAPFSIHCSATVGGRMWGLLIASAPKALPPLLH